MAFDVVKKKKKTASGSRKQYSAPALSKGLDILELMTSEAEGLNLREIAEKLDRSKGEIFRMLVVLEDRGYVRLAPGSDIYSLTLKIFEIAHQHSHVKRLTTVASPIMRRLAKQTQQSCHLVIYFNGRGIVIAQQDSPSERGFGVRLGANVPLDNTCSGHILLAFAEQDILQDMLDAQAQIHSGINKSRLNTLSKRVRNQGFEKVKSQQVQGVIDVGYPLFDYSGKLIAALSIPFLSHLDGSQQINFEKAKDYLEQAASEISAALGYKKK